MTHLPLAIHRPAEHEGGFPAVLQHPQPLALLKSHVPHPVLERQLLFVDQLPSGGIQLEDVDHRNTCHEKEKTVTTRSPAVTAARLSAGPARRDVASPTSSLHPHKTLS